MSVTRRILPRSTWRHVSNTKNTPEEYMERIHVSNTKNTPEEHMEMIYVSNVNNRMLAMLLHIISRDVFF